MVATLKGQGAARCSSRATRSRQPPVRRHAAEPGSEDLASRWLFDIKNLDKRRYKVLPIAEWAGLGDGRQARRAARVQQGGDEVWFSGGARRTSRAALVVVDDKTLKLKTVIRTRA